MPRVSVIIPCYNQGQYLDEAVNSVLKQTYQDYEIIIVNDGSTDEFTINLLNNYHRLKTRVIHTTNQGLPSARNNGIREAKGVYILPLDADDKIGFTYLERAVKVLDDNEDIGIVYCEAEFFGKKTGKWELPKYQFPEFIISNCIFASAFFRRSDWESVKGYKSVMKYGWEDHEFWLSLIELKREIYQIPEIIFYYRQKESSMLQSMQVEHWLYSYLQIYQYHSESFSDNMAVLFKRHIELNLIHEQIHQKDNLLWQKDKELAEQARLIKEVYSSFSWKLGKVLTYPVRKIQQLFR